MVEIVCGLVILLFAGCAAMDVVFRRIPNLLVLAASAAFAALMIVSPPSGQTLALHLLAAALAFTVGAACFAKGWIGGGDVKLAAAVLLWAGPAMAPLVLVVTGAGGWLFALIGLAVRRLERSRAVPVPRWLGALSVTRGVPYGVGLSIGGILAVLHLIKG
ncbi:MAG: hypothetical protein VR70_08555 [Rhodospirillaceae bacterium BRH_c57]|nr:MAG: hypothetical protein VR70_08555 [Rhodospirillaceae bacterium BRH_c57]